MDELLNKCIEFAQMAHKGQKDKGGADYIGHPLRVMEQMDTTEEKIVAVLHDILEDTYYTITDLYSILGIPDNLIESLILLKRRKGENYMTYIQSLTKDPMAVAVKIADLKDNMDLSRLPAVTDHDLERQKRYAEALEILYAAQAQ